MTSPAQPNMQATALAPEEGKGGPAEGSNIKIGSGNWVDPDGGILEVGGGMGWTGRDLTVWGQTALERGWCKDSVLDRCPFHVF